MGTKLPVRFYLSLTDTALVYKTMKSFELFEQRGFLCVLPGLLLLLLVVVHLLSPLRVTLPTCVVLAVDCCVPCIALTPPRRACRPVAVTVHHIIISSLHAQVLSSAAAPGALSSRLALSLRLQYVATCHYGVLFARQKK
jgi:hypothetical protein